MKKLLAALALSLIALANKEAWADQCEKRLYTGFDTRVKARLVGRLAPGSESIVGFEVIHGRPVVALPHRLVLFNPNKRTNLFIADEVESMGTDQARTLWIQTRTADDPRTSNVEWLRPNGMLRDAKLSSDVRGSLHASGTLLMLEVLKEESTTHFVTRRGDGGYALLAKINGGVKVASWNRNGLATVVEQSLYIWPAGGSEFIRIATDAALSEARDACLLGAEHVVLALKDSLVVVTPDAATALVGMQARCAWDGTSLYLLDIRSGLVWAVTGAEKLGMRATDLDHAATLAQSLPKSAPEDSPAALEAARIVGCAEVARLRSQATDQKLATSSSASEAANRSVDLYFQAANESMDKGDYTSAIANFNHVLQLDKNNAAAKAGLERARRAMRAEKEITGNRR